MTTALKLRRGTTTQHSSFTGQLAEVTVDTDKKTVVVHDGATAGGTPLATESSVTGKLNSANPSYTGTLTGGTGVINIGSNQLHKDVSGNIGLGVVPSGTYKLQVDGKIADASGDVRSIPQNSQTAGYTLVAGDNGKHISITNGGVTVPSGVFSVGEVVTIYNNSGVDQTIAQGASTTLRQAGTANTGNRTLAQYGVATVLCVATNTFVITGSGLS